MSWRREFSKFQGLFRRQKPTDDLDEEIRFHLRMEEQENLESGLSPEEAHSAALRRFGNVTGVQERSRAMWRWGAAETLIQDLRFGLRQLRQSPGFTVVAVLTLALGIGANTAIFSVINAVLLRPLPFPDPDRLVQLLETEAAPGYYPLTGADYLDWQAQNRSFAAMSLYSWTRRMSASGAAEPEPVAVVQTQANFFRVLGIQPLTGRTFVPGEDSAGKNHVALVNYAFWQRHFSGSGSAIGKTVQLNGESYIVVGVMPRGFSFPAASDIWTPLDMSPQGLGPRGNHSWNAIGRLKAGIPLAQARQEMLALSERLEKQYPNTNEKVHAALVPLQEQLTGQSGTPLLILFGAVALVLLIACANVANLLLARASGRQREMALRASLGAGRFRLIRQLLTESVLLSLFGTVLGTVGAWWCVRLLATVETAPVPRTNPITIDGSVLIFTVALSLLTGLLFGFAPALYMSRSSLSEELKAAAQSVLSPTGGRRNLRHVLVMGEIAVTLALLTGAGLLLRSFVRLRNAEIGINPHNVLTMTLNLPETKYTTLGARRQFFDQLLDRVRHTPGIAEAAISTEIPLEGGSNGYIQVDGKTDPTFAAQLVEWNYITPAYFHTLGIALQEGRNFTATDADRTAVMAAKLFDLFKAAQGGSLQIPPDLTLVTIINQTAARTFWRNENPVGRSFHWNGVKVLVVGVVGDVKERSIRAKTIPQAYFPLPLILAEGNIYGRLTVKTSLPPKKVLGPIRHHVRALDSSLAVFRARTMEEVIADSTQEASMQTFLLGTLATLALMLAAVGLYGVMSYLVAQRTREIGIRLAVGAKPGDVLRLVLKQGMKLTVTGLALGAVLSLALTRSLASLLYEINPSDPLTFLSVAALLAVIALAANYFPARRATKVDPMRALRYE